MLIALGCMTLVTLTLTGLAYYQERSHREAQAQWALERRELVNRVQRPEAPLPIPATDFEIPEQPPDDWNLVGTIHNDPEAYLRGEEEAAETT